MKQSPAPSAAAIPNVLDIFARFVQGHSSAKEHQTVQLPADGIRGTNCTFCSTNDLQNFHGFLPYTANNLKQDDC